MPPPRSHRPHRGAITVGSRFPRCENAVCTANNIALLAWYARTGRPFIFNSIIIVTVINYLKILIHTVYILRVPAHAFEESGADEPFDCFVQPLHLIDHILPDHESSTGRGTTDLWPQFLVSVLKYFWQENDIDLSKNIFSNIYFQNSAHLIFNALFDSNIDIQFHIPETTELDGYIVVYSPP